jgi:TonB family protein
MKVRRLVITLASVALVLTMGATFVLLHDGSVVSHAQVVENQPGIGVTGTMGFLIESVEPGSSAEQVGLMPGDVIISVGKRRIRSMQDMQASLQNSLDNSGDPVEVVFLRHDPVANRVVNHVVMVSPTLSGQDAQTTAQTKPILGGILNGKAIEKPLPIYPEIARAARASGTVTVQIVIDEEGRVEKAKAVGGHPLLQSAAVEAAYQARFSPTRLSGNPVKVSGMLTYNFVLQ